MVGTNEQPGIMARALDDLYEHIQVVKDTQEANIELRMSYLEVFVILSDVSLYIWNFGVISLPVCRLSEARRERNTWGFCRKIKKASFGSFCVL